RRRGAPARIAVTRLEHHRKLQIAAAGDIGPVAGVYGSWNRHSNVSAPLDRPILLQNQSEAVGIGIEQLEILLQPFPMLIQIDDPVFFGANELGDSQRQGALYNLLRGPALVAGESDATGQIS